jgi:hypothetical protein
MRKCNAADGPGKMELDLKHFSRFAAALGLATVFAMVPLFATAGTTGTISGVVKAQGGGPLAGVAVTAASPSQTATTKTDAHGFFAFPSLLPDTYTVTFVMSGYATDSVPGIAVLQDQNIAVNQFLVPTLQTIAHVQTTAGSSLVKPNQGSDVYNVSGQALTAATNPGDLHETLYQYTAVVPGVTSTGFPAQPRVRGGQVTDLGYEFEGIPIQDNIVGFFTTNLSNIGVQNLEVYTGGLSAEDAANGTGYLNSVLKSGTYPGFTDLAVGITGPDYNHYLSFQSGYATPDHRYSYYIAFDGANSQNQYASGAYTFPSLVMWGYDGDGPVMTRDLVGNFHYKPDANDDIQLVATNSYGDFNFNYLLRRSGNEAPALQLEPCPGAVPASGAVAWSGGTGGTAPNGQTCPEGLYWAALSNGGGNNWYHYGGLGKIQWNHNLNDHSFFSLAIAENYNEYIFDQPLADANSPYWENGFTEWNYMYGGWGLNPADCPPYPYKPGSPVASSTQTTYSFNIDCVMNYGGIQSFWGDRRSEIWLEKLDYEDLVSDNLTIKAGVSNQLNDNVLNYYLTSNFTNIFNEFSWPYKYEISDYPTSEPHVWGEADVRIGKFLLDPGVMWAQRHYGCPGCQTVSIVNPTFNGTYEFSPADVLRFSYGDTSSFIGTAYVYTTPDSGIVRNPLEPGVSYNPQLNHSGDIMWEHQFNPETSLRVGPYFEKTTNYYETYQPIIGYVTVNGIKVPIFSPRSILSNNQVHQDAGFEFALDRIDNHPAGLSFWLTATYDNYWTSSTALAGAFINSPEPQSLINEGHLLRATANPLWSTSFLFDWHMDGFHVDPFVVYQGDYFFYANPGLSFPDCGGNCPPWVSGKQQIASGFWNVNLQVYKDIGPQRNYFVGFQIQNLTNNYDNANLVPCVSNGTGCFPFDGPQSGVKDTPGSLIYQNFTSSPRTFEFMAGLRLGNTNPDVNP